MLAAHLTLLHIGNIIEKNSPLQNPVSILRFPIFFLFEIHLLTNFKTVCWKAYMSDDETIVINPSDFIEILLASLSIDGDLGSTIELAIQMAETQLEDM